MHVLLHFIKQFIQLRQLHLFSFNVSIPCYIIFQSKTLLGMLANRERRRLIAAASWLFWNIKLFFIFVYLHVKYNSSTIKYISCTMQPQPSQRWNSCWSFSASIFVVVFFRSRLLNVSFFLYNCTPRVRVYKATHSAIWEKEGARGRYPIKSVTSMHHRLGYIITMCTLE